MTDSERIEIKDYIDARIGPLETGQARIERKVDRLYTKLDGVQSAEDRSDGAAVMKATIWKAAGTIIVSLAAVAGVVVAVIPH